MNFGIVVLLLGFGWFAGYFTCALGVAGRDKKLKEESDKRAEEILKWVLTTTDKKQGKDDSLEKIKKDIEAER